MKIAIRSTEIHCNNADSLLAKYPILADYNFEKKVIQRPEKKFIRDENGKLISQIIEDRFFCITETYITIDSLEHLFKLLEAVDCDLVLTTGFYADADYEIEIYDGYRE